MGKSIRIQRVKETVEHYQEIPQSPITVQLVAPKERDNRTQTSIEMNIKAFFGRITLSSIFMSGSRVGTGGSGSSLKIRKLKGFLAILVRIP